MSFKTPLGKIKPFSLRICKGKLKLEAEHQNMALKILYKFLKV